jgi:hypothetical protein
MNPHPKVSLRKDSYPHPRPHSYFRLLMISPPCFPSTPSTAPNAAEQCTAARQTLQNRLETFRAQLSEVCGLGKGVQVPVPLQKGMQDTMEQVCWLKREGVSKAYAEVENVLERGVGRYIGTQ